MLHSFSIRSRPIFRITVLYVDEKESVRRQLGRGIKVRQHNERVRETARGHLIRERATDTDEKVPLGWRMFLD